MPSNSELLPTGRETPQKSDRGSNFNPYFPPTSDSGYTEESDSDATFEPNSEPSNDEAGKSLRNENSGASEIPGGPSSTAVSAVPNAAPTTTGTTGAAAHNSSTSSRGTDTTITTAQSSVTATPQASSSHGLAASKKPSSKNTTSNMTVEAETVAAVPTVAVAAAEIPNMMAPGAEDTTVTEPEPNHLVTESEENPETYASDQPMFSDENSTYNDEMVPTGSQTPLNLPNTLLTAAPNNIKLKKSIDNVALNNPAGPSNSNNTIKRHKKKKPSRVAGTTKAEIFAARIARAVDEVDSSDSDETFVYDSNPHTDSTQGSASNSASGVVPRPRFPNRNMSTSSLSVPEQQQHSIPNINQIQSTVVTPSVTTPPLTSGLPNAPRRGSGNLSQRNLHQHLSATEGSVSEDQGFLLPTRTLQHKSSNPKQLRKTLSSPRANSHNGVSLANGGGPSTGGSRNSSKYSSLNSNDSQLPLPNLRGKPSRMFAVASGGNNSTGNGNKNSRRWRPSGAGPSTAYMDEDDEDEAEGDIDDDDYLDVTEVTPLRHSKQTQSGVGGTGGSGYGGTYNGANGTNGRSLRLSRKNGGIMVYSPHNYQEQRALTSRYYYVRMMLWVTLFIVFVVGFGFVLGFLYATSKPLSDLKFSRVFDVLASDDELAFEIVVEAYNPGLLAVTLENVDLDVFARSPYVDDEQSGGGGWFGGGDGKDEGPHTMKLGTIQSFDVPVFFEGGFFNRRPGKAIADVRLQHPGFNSTIDDDDSLDLKAPSSGDDSKDDGQKRWSRVSVHPFDLTIRGVVKYELFMGRWKSVSVAKTMKVDPNGPHGGDEMYI